MKKALLALTLLIFVLPVKAIPVTGKVTDQQGQPIPFANVYIKGTTTGTTTNIDGDYTLELKPGKYELVFKLISYKMHVELVEVASQRITLNIKLSAESFHLKEVAINASAEDPAYAVIREAIKKRKYYLDQVDAYSCNVYIKGVQKITKHPEKIMGMDLDISGLFPLLYL